MLLNHYQRCLADDAILRTINEHQTFHDQQLNLPARTLPINHGGSRRFRSTRITTSWDTRSGYIVQEYDRHLNAVNTITFVNQNRCIVTTSDDKSLRVLEWGIPVDFMYPFPEWQVAHLPELGKQGGNLRRS
ncbi:hypothetical protein quinque_014188 [Culex quinquefasciatus]